MSSPLIEFFRISDVAPIVAAIAFMIGGSALMFYAVKRRQLPVSERVDLLLASPQAPRAEIARHEAFVRLPEGTVPERERREIERLFAHFGVSAEHAQTALLVFRVTLIVVLAMAFYALPQSLFDLSHARIVPLGFGLMGAISGWLLPTFIVEHLAGRHVEDVAAGLPDALELLVVCVGAGLALEDGIDRIVVELEKTQPALAEELALTSADLKILPNRDQALANLAARIDVPSVRSVVATLAQTMRYGTPLAQALRVVASEMRNDALIAMEASANRLPTYLTLPMMLFIMPTIFLIVGGPAALRVIDVVF